MISSWKEDGPMTLSCVGACYTFTLGLSRSCSKRSLGGLLPPMAQLCRLICSETWNFASSVKTIIRLKKWWCSDIFAHNVCRILRPKLLFTCCKFLDYLSLYCYRRSLFRRILCTAALALEVDVFGLSMKAYLTWSTFSWHLLGSQSKLLVPSPSALVIMQSHTIITSQFTFNANSGFNTACAFCCTVCTVLILQNM
jgi:hypothetical protein